ncbi:MAG: alpha/beta hydrolase [Planctomycetota bacterium]
MVFTRSVRSSICSWLLVSVFAVTSAVAEDSSSKSAETVEIDVRYRPQLNDPLVDEFCRLDIAIPADQSDFPTVVWFHGGGLKSGDKKIPKALRERGIGVVSANYRLHPKVSAPTYIEDAAAAVAWTFKNIERYGGSAKRIYVSGHSAGGYLTSMVGLDKSYLAKHGIDANQIKGLVPLSGHTITHFTVRAEQGIDKQQPTIDSFAPLFHVREDCPPLLLITGDRELEMLGRYEENAYLARMMAVAGHEMTELNELDGFNHGKMVRPAIERLINFVKADR